jgi:hypothetical protein
LTFLSNAHLLLSIQCYCSVLVFSFNVAFSSVHNALLVLGNSLPTKAYSDCLLFLVVGFLVLYYHPQIRICILGRFSRCNQDVLLDSRNTEHSYRKLLAQLQRSSCSCLLISSLENLGRTIEGLCKYLSCYPLIREAFLAENKRAVSDTCPIWVVYTTCTYPSSFQLSFL